MRHPTLQRAARAAFSNEDWMLLGNDQKLRRKFMDLASVEDVEEFVFAAYDRLRALREPQPEVATDKAR